ncbi:MAG: hypothetical protein K9M49_04105 [Candidatus Marinimicrobia bacterium]|nr:hypothetical protein [Candidatus Neomarinimicrobiota bacterium]MCF7851327.1 hypothetical protein [Candidatus Neomarinimicrobiota bacterium]MCF7904318.1 hypothetical protein [Candidatus Neomarinimicrobiota bacterium]
MILNLEWTEWLGYLASITVAISLMMSNIRRLRWINLLGALIFTLYGAILELYPILVVNAFIVGVNIYYLFRMYLTRDRFHLLPVSHASSIFLPHFIQYYRQDISEHFPAFDTEHLAGKEALFITRNVIPVGLIIYEEKPDKTIHIHLDFAIPMYRDYENAAYFFQEFSTLMAAKGFRRYISYCKVPVHQRYLRRMKFEEDQEEPGRFVRRI